MIENNHFLARTLLVFPLLRLFLQQETFTPLRHFPPTLLLPLQYQGLRQLRPYVAGKAPAALSLKTSSEPTDLSFFYGFLTCSPEAAVTSTLTSAEPPDSPGVRRP